MKFNKPKFWDCKKQNLISYLLLPITFLVKAAGTFVKTSKPKKFEIKTICVGNFYIGGTGKTSLSIKINEILNEQKIKSCFFDNCFIALFIDSKEACKIFNLNISLTDATPIAK